MSSAVDNLITATAALAYIADEAACINYPEVHIVCDRDTYHRMLATIEMDPKVFRQPTMDRDQWIVNGIVVTLKRGWVE